MRDCDVLDVGREELNSGRTDVSGRIRRLPVSAHRRHYQALRLTLALIRGGLNRSAQGGARSCGSVPTRRRFDLGKSRYQAMRALIEETKR